MKYIVYILLFIICFAITSKMQISFDPFSVKMPRFMTAAGWTLIIMGVVFVSVDTAIESSAKAETRIISKINNALEESKLYNDSIITQAQEEFIRKHK